MLKTNYISSNLGQFIRKIMARTSKLEIAMMLQRLHEYQPVPRKTFLNEILAYDEPLFCPVWLQSSIWILLYDEELGSLATPPMTKDAIAGRIRRLLAMADKRARELGVPDTEASISPDLLN